MDASGTTIESCNLMVPKDQIDSPSLDEDSCGVSSLGRKPLKKGPWTSAEDAILTEYVRKHGEGNWNAVQKNTGLSRCGKSCRLRWANHLKPHLKKGAFTAEEEKLIIELHARMGNKWARMAGYLPGRTDNEIKNYWNTRIKRCLRAGLPLYPPNMCFQVSNDNRHFRNAVGFNSRNKRHNELSQGSSYNFPDIIFGNFKPNQAATSYAQPFPDISMSTMLSQGIGSPNIAFTNPGSSQTFYPGFHDTVTPKFENVSDTVGRILGLDFPYVPDPGRRSLAPFGGAIPGSHAIFSASKPLNGTEKSELPSLQYPEADLCSWVPPHDEAVDMFIQSPSIQSDSVSAQNSGLLDALLHGAKKTNGSSNQPSEMSSNSSSSDAIEWSSLDLHVKDWDASSDPISPLGCSAISVFSEFTPPISGSSEDLTDKLPSGTECGRIPRLPDLSRPDALLGADWLSQGSEIGRDHSILNDAIATLLGDDFYGEYKHSSPGTPSSSGHASELLSME